MIFNQTDADAYNNKGVSLHSLGRYEEALAAYDKAIAIDPTDADAHYNKGVALSNMTIHTHDNRLAEALTEYNKAIILNTTDRDAYSRKGLLLLNLSRNEEALAAFDKAIAIDHAPVAYVLKGGTLNLLGRNEEALAAYNNATKLDTNNEFAQIISEMKNRNHTTYPLTSNSLSVN